MFLNRCWANKRLMIDKLKSTFDDGNYFHIISYSQVPFLPIVRLFLNFLDARLSNSSTFRGWLESTGLDDILVIELTITQSINQSSSWSSDCLFCCRWTPVTASLGQTSFPRPLPGTQRRQQVAGRGRCTPSSREQKSEDNGSLSWDILRVS